MIKDNLETYQILHLKFRFLNTFYILIYGKFLILFNLHSSILHKFIRFYSNF